MPAIKNIIGKRFGSLIIWERRGKKCLCKCDCGKWTLPFLQNVLRGLTRSCGCMRGDLRHGHCRFGKVTRTYQAWHDMIGRCRESNKQTWKNYSGKGICVCERWRQSFEAFLRDMGECPFGLELDRFPNPSGNYEPGNCRWANRKEQMRNRINNRILTVRGIKGCLAELCEHFNVPDGRTRSRLKEGWSVEDAFFMPQQFHLRMVTVKGITGSLSHVCRHFKVPYHRVWRRLRRGWKLNKALLISKRPNRWKRG